MGTEYKVNKIHTNTHTVNKQSENKIFKIPISYNSIKKETKIFRDNVKTCKKAVYEIFIRNI